MDMYRILVVDDEKTERECVRFLIEEAGLALQVEEAGDGREALEKLKETGGADILFTDVQMPGMDGLELIRRAEMLFPDMKILIFSSYADFEYARTALTLGVVNYILKPVVPEELKRSLEGLIGQLDEEEASRRQQDKQQSFMLQYALQLAISGNFDREKAEPTIPEQMNRFRTMVLLDFEGDFLENNSFVFYESLRCALKLDMESLNLSPDQALLMLRSPVERPEEWGGRVLSHIRETFQISCWLSISRPLSSYSSLKDAYAKVEQQMEQRFWAPEKHVFTEEGDGDRAENGSGGMEEERQMLQIKRALGNRDGAALQEALDSLFDRYRSRQNQSQIYVKFLFSNLLTTLYPYLAEDRGRKASLDAMISSLYLQPDISEIVRQVQETASGIIEGFSAGPAVRREIVEVTEYIGANYGKELSVELLASIVYLTPDYLSRLFKRSMGKSISQYIRQFRMEKARELLTGTSRKVIDIGEAVGYPNYSYFCQSFREYFGTSPEKYRQEKMR
ncbi:MAG TPA: response regulator [Candidatus Eisenbergiella merdavium]|uniref:Stage 0 sporulation protein A homolog n=1 Tax=Candidatus Eisenbergiella merdavium TaxID=2838551 RepID=A0A9D2SRJ6_9FIRM|nr:response regulator [Candidatus Eisenbergiella merdavium]